MHLTFRLRFRTHAGQSIWFAGEPPLPHPWVLMQFQNQEFWEVTFAVDRADLSQPLNYSYIVRHANGSQVTDWDRDRTVIPEDFAGGPLLVLDAWNEAGFPDNAFYTRPFKKVLLAENFTEVPAVKTPGATHTLRVKAPLLARRQTVCLLGEGPALGNWQTQQPRLLSRARGEDAFSAQLDLRGQPMPLAYKYGVYDVEKKAFVCYEEGANRGLHDSVTAGKHTLVNDGFLRLPADTWHGAGVAVPVFSLRSQNSFGVGEFSDLKLLADWGGQTGLKLIQLLPVNDTSVTHTWRDSYPYAAISAFALHPLYLNLAAAANVKNRRRLAELEAQRQQLNALETVDYEAVMRAKLGFLKAIFPSQKAGTFRSPAYRQFFADHHRWLVPYAAFCVLRDRFGTPDFSQWPEHGRFDAKAIAALATDNDDVAFHYFLQFHLHQQLLEATAHVHACGLVMKGDIAIGVHRHSADVWQQPELFHVDRQAGAPPDAFSAKGQNWGFPTYNWPRMAADGFAWWKQRFAQMSCYFDAFRIDHILGFFRIWSNPAHAVEGILGRFEPAIPVAFAEFAARGIPFDHERLTLPFINDAVLTELFGKDQALIRRAFLIARGDGTYSLKPEFATQRQVADHFSKRAANAADLKLKTGVFDLISNVILFDVEGAHGKQFHFRFAMHDTASFKHLPPGVQPKMRELYVDYFFRRQDDFWLREAMQKLPALKRVTDMLVCGEDLGLVPACVPGLMKELGLLSLEIQRMPKTPGRDFSRPAEAPYLSVVTPSTHDMSTLRGWWEEDAALTQKFFNRELGRAGAAPRTCGPELVQAMVRQHLASPAMWSIFQLQDLLGLDADLRRAEVAAERINLPAIPDYYWRYRMHLDLERLLLAEDFNGRLAELLRENGR